MEKGRYRMRKKELTPRCLIPVRPILIVGANVAGKANFFEVGGGGSVSTDPPMVAVPIRHERYTLKGILENRTFSVNIPPVQMAKEADYCGIVSGLKTDKVSDCRFNIFYGKVGTAPMIEQFPINMECSVAHILSTNSHSIVLGRIDGTYVSQELLSEGELDLNKLTPLLWFSDKSQYVSVGEAVGKSRSIGNELKIGR
jgi:flavin reductase (DIM6/NTAB) family NADH-FMN oxidoreductase RutF